jgi:nicotinamide riboside kinase
LTDNLTYPLVVCFAGGPGSGKSTIAASVFATLKKMNINAELVTEYAKDKTWEGNMCALRCQEYVFGKQSYKLARCKDDVDVIVTDSPLFLGLMYNHNPALDEHFDHLVMNVFNSYNNMVYFVNRVKPYNPSGRNQTEYESDKIAQNTKNLMGRFSIPYVEINGDSSGEEHVISDVLAKLSQMELNAKVT